MNRGFCNKCKKPLKMKNDYEIIRNTKGYGLLCGTCSVDLTKRVEKNKIKLTKEDILKYGTKEEVEFLKEKLRHYGFLASGGFTKDKKKCERCKKEISKKEYDKNGRVCDMCEEDITLGRDKE